MSEALREYFSKPGKLRSNEAVKEWIDAHYRGKWAAGTLRDHLYGGRVNHPLAYKHHPGQKKFLYDHGGHVFERYDPKRHGQFHKGVAVEGEVPTWILIHSRARYSDPKWHSSPSEELSETFKVGMRWHWKLPRPMKDDERPRTILLAWEQCVFGEATATVTRDIGKASKVDFNFAFVLLDYQPLNALIPLSALRLGNREREHRSLIRLTKDNLAAFRGAKRSAASASPETAAVPEEAHIESAVETGANPQHGRQGFGLTSRERKRVEDRAMKVATAYLRQKGYDVEDVSSRNPFDLRATRGRKELKVEVKGTTGQGVEILLTKNEVELHRLCHPANMLIVVHSIALARHKSTPSATGGKIWKKSPWKIDDLRLKPIAFSYRP